MSRVVHFEIHADDPDRAVAFYSRVFGWQFKKWDGPAEYWLITTGPDDQMGINGGLLRRCEKCDAAPAHAEVTTNPRANSFVCTVGVQNLDETLQKLTAAGGTIAVPKMSIPKVGWIAYATDTEGNRFGVIQPVASVKMRTFAKSLSAGKVPLVSWREGEGR